MRTYRINFYYNCGKFLYSKDIESYTGYEFVFGQALKEQLANVLIKTFDIVKLLNF